MSKRCCLLLLYASFLRAQLPAPVPAIGWPATDPGDGALATLTPVAATSMALAPDGSILYAEIGRIRRIDSAGRIRTVITDLRISSSVIAVDGAGNIYYTSSNLPAIMESAGGGAPVQIAGGGTSRAADGAAATNVSLVIGWIAIGPGGLFLSDRTTFRVYRLDTFGILHAVAGTGTSGTAGEGGPAASAQLAGPGRIGFDAAANLCIEDSTANGVRWLKVAATGTLTRVANPTQYAGGFSVAPDGSIYYTSTVSNGLNQLQPNGVVVPVTVTNGLGFEGCGTGPFPPQQFAAGEAQAISSNHGLLVLTRQAYPFGRQKIVQIDSAGVVTLVAGGPDEFSGDGGPASAASLINPQAIATDAAGDLFIADAGNHRVRKVTPDGIIQSVAGAGPVASTLYCKPPAGGYLASITGVAVDKSGALYIADQGANVVWRQAPGGQLTPFAGNGQGATYGAAIGSAATAVPLDILGPIALDGAGNLWLVSNSNGLVKVAPSGVITDVLTQIAPRSVSPDPSGTVYAATNERVYRIAADDSLIPVTAVSATPQSFEGPGGPGGIEYTVGVPSYAGPAGLAAVVDTNGTLYFLLSTGMQTISRSCVAASMSASASAGFSSGVFNVAGGIYLVDTLGNRIWTMAAAPVAGASSVSLGPAAVRSLGSGAVLQNPTGFAAGGDGLGLTSYQYISDTIAPGELIRILGACLGPANPVEAAYDAGGNIPLALGGTQVLFDGVAAPLVSVVGGEIVAVTPYALAGKSQTTMSVVNANGQAGATLTVAAVAPGLFHYRDPLGTDTVVALNNDGSRNTRASPAAPGSVIAIYATGLGQTAPPSLDGAMRTGDRQVAAKVSVTINNVPATVLYAGPAPGFVGLEQINVQVPATTSGPVALSANGILRPPSPTLWIGQ